MTPHGLANYLKNCALVAAVSSVLSLPMLAQGPVPDAPSAATSAAIESSASVAIPPYNAYEHRFWDNENRVLFAATLLSSGADFAVTRSNLQSGGQELNPIVRMFGRTTPGLAMNFAGETAGVIGISYFLHKTGHHKLERAISSVNIAGSTGAVAYGLTHR